MRRWERAAGKPLLVSTTACPGGQLLSRQKQAAVLTKLDYRVRASANLGTAPGEAIPHAPLPPGRSVWRTLSLSRQVISATMSEGGNDLVVWLHLAGGAHGDVAGGAWGGIMSAHVVNMSSARPVTPRIDVYDHSNVRRRGKGGGGVREENDGLRVCRDVCWRAAGCVLRTRSQGTAAPAFALTPPVNTLGSEYMFVGLGCGMVGVFSVATGELFISRRMPAPIARSAPDRHAPRSARAGQLVRELSLGMPATSQHFAALALFEVAPVLVRVTP